MGQLVDFAAIEITGFDWNKGNIDKNWIKHKVTVKECEEVFFNLPLLLFTDKKHSQKENRIVAYGLTDKGRTLTIVFTIRENKIRVISARDQQKKERRLYEQTQINSKV